mmetsp:Transcript_40427/g.49038  ORF Transcript_40427/g.49038 Transcript_40427/m.49038 type:complete len:119 (+) Transcript_40427:149-505(+)
MDSEIRSLIQEMSAIPSAGTSPSQADLSTSPKWTLRGYIPPKELRLPTFEYGVLEETKNLSSARSSVANGGHPSRVEGFQVTGGHSGHSSRRGSNAHTEAMGAVLAGDVPSSATLLKL